MFRRRVTSIKGYFKLKKKGLNIIYLQRNKNKKIVLTGTGHLHNKI